MAAEVTRQGVVQSSSLVTLLAMSFVGAGLVALPGAIALLFGANLGTTTGAWRSACASIAWTPGSPPR
ncbi:MULTISPECIES: hypothetical protein [unclassified Halomonas]|uniref:hypothetical protein n=1 Tax=unclassified Halomonas TaxID=2609666 RepID=UPI0003B840A7|nr:MULTISPECIES: hypothetical protein [unclassified Halomonas]ERS91613.1 hypothetical protein Q671_03995 [Halomonas sp. PBN3]